ncbi:hypothetical protein DMN91_000068 [Ooceraea biroi]|uniref:Reverse transcriptase Ty1/copia-type domain-containing protein n=1 Tax=Ooceraea biroi TaxID=2015173 RepID=A0A3L8E0N3_OOCBI|nr:hypothetical protein DMN91_000068 [Ooceraea biroi]
MYGQNEDSDHDSESRSSDKEGDEENEDVVFLEANENVEEAREPEQERRTDQAGENRMQRDEAAPRRSERKWKPVSRPGYVAFLASEDHTSEPSTIEEAMAGTESQNWVKAMLEEIHSLRKNDTWDEVDRPPGVKPLAVKWVFKKKLTESGEIRYKARLVAKGCAQIKGRDYHEVFSPVIRHSQD